MLSRECIRENTLLELDGVRGVDVLFLENYFLLEARYVLGLCSTQCKGFNILSGDVCCYDDCAGYSGFIV